MRKINKIILHCSYSEFPADDNIEVIRQWHLEKGWSDVGYHFFIRKSGLIDKGRDLDIVGAHVAGHNNDSIGICLHGKTNFTTSQFLSLEKLINSLNIVLQGLPTIHGHCEFDERKPYCPGFDITEFVENFL